MAEGSRTDRNTERRIASGRAQVLLDAIEFFENRRRGRAGIPLPNLMRAPHDGNKDGQEVGQSGPCSRAQALDMLVPGLGVFLHGEEEAGASFLLHLQSHKPLPRPVGPVAPFNPPGMPLQQMGRGRGRGFPPPSPPTSPPPQGDWTPSVRCHEHPLRQPRTMPLCLHPLGHFPTLPSYTVGDPNAPSL